MHTKTPSVGKTQKSNIRTAIAGNCQRSIDFCEKRCFCDGVNCGGAVCIEVNCGDAVCIGFRIKFQDVVVIEVYYVEWYGGLVWCEIVIFYYFEPH
jgi:hypothetical protein